MCCSSLFVYAGSGGASPLLGSPLMAAAVLMEEVGTVCRKYATP
jgi:hypothetical protein